MTHYSKWMDRLARTGSQTSCSHQCSLDSWYRSQNKTYRVISRLHRRCHWGSVSWDTHSHNFCCTENQFGKTDILSLTDSLNTAICTLYRLHCCCRTGWDTSPNKSGCREATLQYSWCNSSSQYRSDTVPGMPYIMCYYSCRFQWDTTQGRTVDKETLKEYSSDTRCGMNN